MKNLWRHTLVCGFVLLTPAFSFPTDAEVIFDSVVAAVDGKPITLSELNSRLTGKKVTIQDLQSNEDARQMMDMIIIERVVALEAEAKGLSVQRQEIDAYIDQVARQNNLSRTDFEKALKQQGKSLTEYSNEITSEILRGKLMSAELRRSIVVTDEEAKALIRRSRGLTPDAQRTITLQALVVSKKNYSDEEFKSRVRSIQKALADSSFEEVIEDYSDDEASKKNRGLLGELSETSLDPEVFMAVGHLKVGETTEPVPTTSGFTIFHVVARSDTPADEVFSEEELAKSREFLKQRRMQERMGSFLTQDIAKKYTIDKKV